LEFLSMAQLLRCTFLSFLVLFAFSGQLLAEGNGSGKLEDTIPMPKKDAGVDLTKLKRAKLTEDQAIKQLKFMMVKGFARMQDLLIKEGSFPPFGLSLLPDGEFKAIIPDTGGQKIPSEIELVALAKNLEKIAKTRTMWAIGLMYIRAIKRKDGTYAQRIIVMTEHIAGWARHWAYPFKVVDGDVKLGKPTETSVEPVYYVNK
jgi:hypothetical protein